MVNKEYPIVLITDNNYVVPTAVAIESLIDSFKGKGKLVVCIIACDVKEENKALFHKFRRRNVKIRIVDYSANEMKHFDEEGYYVTGTALVKFCIPRLLPEYDKILYIDGDVLVQKDMTDIFSVDIKDCYAAVVEDMGGVSCGLNRKLALPRYFNSGVLLLNSKRLKDDRIEERLFAVKKTHPEYVCMDQDVFNDVFDMKVKFLPQKWNLMMPNLLPEGIRQEGFSLKEINSFYGSSYTTMKKMEQDACLIHLTNEKKPWKYKDIYMSKEWYRIFRKTPFKKTKLNLQRACEPVRPMSSRRIGFLCLKKFTDRTDLTLFGIPFLRKRYVSPVTTIWLLGIPVVKRVWYEYEIVTKILFFIRFRKPNWYNIDIHLDNCLRLIQDVGIYSDRNKNVMLQLLRMRSGV